MSGNCMIFYVEVTVVPMNDGIRLDHDHLLMTRGAFRQRKYCQFDYFSFLTSELVFFYNIGCKLCHGAFFPVSNFV
jgi:hypothetical protein